jgi:peptidyl-prolyl cis-trans isomerase SurA
MVELRYSITLTLLCFALLLASWLVGLPHDAQAQSGDHRIVRVVNDQPISTYDVDARLRFVAVSGRSAVTGEALNRLRTQVIENLIDEQLQMQEAKRLDLTVSDEEIQAAVSRIENQNKMQAGQLIALLTSRNVDANTLVSQIRSTLAWRKVVSQRLRNNIHVRDEDVDAYLDGLQQKGGTEYLLGEILISVKNPGDSERALGTASQLLSQMRNGTPFTQIARQFSQAPTAGTGGDAGWVRLNQLEPAVADAVELLQAGQISPPINSSEGYYLVAVRQTRKFGAEGQQETLYDLRRLFLSFDPKASNQRKRAVFARATQARQQFRTCEAVEKFATAAGDPKNGTLGEVRLGDMPPGLQPVVKDLKVGVPSQVIGLGDGALVLMLCGKRQRALGLPERDAVRENLMQREASIAARRYLQELRQNAIIQTVQERS